MWNIYQCHYYPIRQREPISVGDTTLYIRTKRKRACMYNFIGFVLTSPHNLVNRTAIKLRDISFVWVQGMSGHTSDRFALLQCYSFPTNPSKALWHYRPAIMVRSPAEGADHGKPMCYLSFDAIYVCLQSPRIPHLPLLWSPLGYSWKISIPRLLLFA